MTKASLSRPNSKKAPAPAIDRDDEALEELGAGLGRAIRAIKAAKGIVPEALRPVYEQYGLGPRHAHAIGLLAHEGPMSVSAFAERLGLSVATTSLMLGELSRSGLVERREDEADRRRTIVNVADEYRDTCSAWDAERRESLRRTLDRLSPAERRGFLEGLRILSEELEASLASTPARHA